MPRRKGYIHLSFSLRQSLKCPCKSEAESILIPPHCAYQSPPPNPNKGIAVLLRCFQAHKAGDQISLLVSSYRHSWTEFTKLSVSYYLTWVCSVFCLFLVEISCMKAITFAYTHHPFQRDANVTTRPGPLNPDKGLEALKTNTQNQNRRFFPALTLLPSLHVLITTLQKLI